MSQVQWIKCSERLPDRNKSVWVCANGRVYRDKIWHGWMFSTPDMPTHWAEIETPAPPNLEQPTKDVATHQPAPTGEGAVVLDAVIANLQGWDDRDGVLLIPDLKARAEEGLKKYGIYLRTNNGRDALMDAYQEALDLVMYTGQFYLEVLESEGGASRRFWFARTAFMSAVRSSLHLRFELGWGA